MTRLLPGIAALGPWTARASELTDPLPGLHRIELPCLVELQGNGSLGAFMHYVSMLGPVEFGAAVAGVLFLGFNPRLGLRIGIFLTLCLWFREVLALALHSPRPYWLEPSLQIFGELSPKGATFGLPSGHALGGVAVWLYLALEARKALVWAAAVGAPLAVAFSRVYLGVHFFSDVSLGLVVGVLVTLFYRRLESPVTSWLSGHSFGARVAAALAASLGMVSIAWLFRETLASGTIPESWAAVATTARKLDGCARLAGTILGVTAGFAALRGFPVSAGALWKRLLAMAVAGAVVYWPLRPALSWVNKRIAAFEAQESRALLVFLFFTLVTGAGAFLISRLFLRLGLHRLEPEPADRHLPATPP